MEFVIPDILENSARAFPYKEAVISGTRCMTYGELDEGANALAEHLLRLGIRKSDRIGILLEKSIESALSIYGIAKSGGVFVNINPHLMPNQVAYLIENCGMRCVIISDRYIDKIRPKQKVSILNVTEFDRILDSSRPENNRPVELVESDLATIIYTSGSMGQPKGVVQNHRNLVSGAHIVVEYLQNTARDRIISVLPFHFDYGLNQMLSAHLVGGTLVLQKSMYPKHICDTLIEKRITGFAGIPTLWIQLFQRYSPFKRLSFPDLRYITNSGGLIPIRYLRQLREVLPDAKIYLMYGLTEAFRSTYLSPEQIEKRPSSIGKAIPNVQIHVLNEKGEECKPGEPGELVHRGANVFLGYWNDPEATARTLRPYPFSPDGVVSRETVVYSGDIVTKDEEGFLYFVERRDNMIKSAGYRISPQEIEDVLYRIDKVKEATVIGLEDDLLGHRIKAFLSVRDEEVLREKEVRDFCADFLPSYMIPHEIELFREDLPKTGTGKIDKTKLRNGYGHK